MVPAIFQLPFIEKTIITRVLERLNYISGLFTAVSQYIWESHCVLSTQVATHGGEPLRFYSHTQRVVRNFSLSLADV